MKNKIAFVSMSILFVTLLLGCVPKPTSGENSITNTKAPEMGWHYGYGTDYEDSSSRTKHSKADASNSVTPTHTLES